MSRRRFLSQTVALVALGAIAGGAIVEYVVHRGGGRETGGSPGPGGNPGSSGAVGSGPLGSVPPGILPTPSGESPEPIASAPPPGPARVLRENLRPGTNVWELPLRGTGNAEAYATEVSVAEGQRIEFRIASAAARGDVTLYRLGWYGGAGARVVARWKDVPIASRGDSTTDPVTGLIRCAWAPAVTATVPQGWVSGLYLAVVSPDGGAPQYAHFIVREARPTAPILFLSSATTHQAYNNWGGKSLYPDESTGAPTVTGAANAVTVSWDRPYADNRGAGLVLRWEYPFVRWLESRGYDVGYAADLDLERNPSIAAGRRLLVFAGHPEYWSAAMRRTLESAIAAGTNVAFFSADEIYWKVRFESTVGGPYRTVTCYRRTDIDPQAAANPSLATVKWRDPPIRDPESLVIGQMYGHVVLTPAAFVCSAPDHWVYAGSAMRAGDAIQNLVGQEYDRVFPSRALSPAGLEILAVSPVLPNLGHESELSGGVASDEPQPPVANATIYTAPSGATVFSAGTMQWSWGLDGWGSPEFEGVHTTVDPRVGRITANILDRLGA